VSLPRLCPRLTRLYLGHQHRRTRNVAPALEHRALPLHVHPVLSDVTLEDQRVEVGDIARWASADSRIGRVALRRCVVVDNGTQIPDADHSSLVWSVLGGRLVELSQLRVTTLTGCDHVSTGALHTCCPRLESVGIIGGCDISRTPVEEAVALDLVASACAALGRSLKKVDLAHYHGLDCGWLESSLRSCTALETLRLPVRRSGMLVVQADAFRSLLRRIGPSLRNLTLAAGSGDWPNYGASDAAVLTALAEHCPALETLSFPDIACASAMAGASASENAGLRAALRETLLAIDVLETRAPKVCLTRLRANVEMRMDTTWVL
jgi:hypothetical protein